MAQIHEIIEHLLNENKIIYEPKTSGWPVRSINNVISVGYKQHFRINNISIDIEPNFIMINAFNIKFINGDLTQTSECIEYTDIEFDSKILNFICKHKMLLIIYAFKKVCGTTNNVLINTIMFIAGMSMTAIMISLLSIVAIVTIFIYMAHAILTILLNKANRFNDYLINILQNVSSGDI
jgi:hypothetical protein